MGAVNIGMFAIAKQTSNVDFKWLNNPIVTHVVAAGENVSSRGKAAIFSF